MSEFWGRALSAPPSQPVAPTPRAWWQDSDPYGQLHQPQELAPGANSYPTSYGQSNEEAVVRKLRGIKGAARNLSPEDAELIAQYDLVHKAKYQAHCPQCDSGNFLPAGSKIPGNSGVMPTDRCFDCGLSARGPDMAVGGVGGGGTQTRQTDTGGYGGQSMYMQFRSVPESYRPRA